MNNVRIREVREEALYNPLILTHAVPFTQAFFYGEWQEGMGRRVRRFVGESASGPVIFFQTIEYPLPLGKSYVYIPYGPITMVPRGESLMKTLSEFVLEAFRGTHAIFVRFDFSPTLMESEMPLAEKYFRAGDAFSYRGSSYQPRAEWVIDLTRPEEEILKRMDKKNRYGIRVAEENKIEARIIDKNLRSHFDIFYRLIQETAERDRFREHPKLYYERIFESCEKRGCGFLVESLYKGEPATSDFIVWYEDTATWVFGGSSTKARDVSPSYLAQWSAMRYAKKIGCASYSFGGVSEPPFVEQSWGGLSRFKKRFGGRALLHSAFFDVVLNPLWYRLYMVQKRIRG
ncbi:MAG TPA: peptidoglycan bridge formation glycyltransferase FemA/FemB family protein [Candidatus Paceibacterota bacterium]